MIASSALSSLLIMVILRYLLLFLGEKLLRSDPSKELLGRRLRTV